MKTIYKTVAFILALGLTLPVFSQTSGDRFDSYPQIFFRGKEFWGKHCYQTSVEKEGLKEIYMLRSGLNDWVSGKVQKVTVAEYFSGRVYSTTFKVIKKYIGTLKGRIHQIELNCESKTHALPLSKATPFSADGSYLQYVNVDARGNYGTDVYVEKCEIGSDCDVGTQALIRKCIFSILALLPMKSKHGRQVASPQ